MDTGDHGHGPGAPSPTPTPNPSPIPAPRPAPRGMMLGAVVVLSGFVVSQGPNLYDEVNGLMAERDRSRLTSPIGFIDIAPQFSYAVPPRDWAHSEGDELLLWAGWKGDTRQHSWFRVGKNDLDVSKLHIPIGSDALRAIDHTRLESHDGAIWNRMQPEMRVLPLTIQRQDISLVYAYPIMLLERVQAVNDTLAELPRLVLFTPFVPPEQSLDVFDPILDGHRVRLASSGHFIEPGRRPIMYDQDRRDLWVRDPQGMLCLAGARKGAVLKRLPLEQTLSWEDWSREHPDGRLIVGAFRDQTTASAPVPARENAPAAP